MAEKEHVPAQAGHVHLKEAGAEAADKDEIASTIARESAQGLITGEAEDELSWADTFILGALLLVAAALPFVAFHYFFSGMGYGTTIYEKSESGEYHVIANILLYCACAIFGIGWMLDVEEWEAPFARRLRDLLGFVAIACFTIGALMWSNYYPYAPICLYMLEFPMYLIFLFRILSMCTSKHITIRKFMAVVPFPLFLLGVCDLVYWGYWIYGKHNRWSSELQEKYALDIGCAPDDDDAWTQDDDGAPWGYDSCTEAFLIWAAPLPIAGGTMLYGVIAYLLDPEDTHKASNMFGLVLVLLMFAMWVAGSLSSAGTQLTEAFMAFVATGFIALCLMVAATFGASFDSATESHFVKDMSKKWAGWDSIFKGLFIVTSFPIVLTYFMIAAVNQGCRRCGLGKSLSNENTTINYSQDNDPAKSVTFKESELPVTLIAFKLWQMAKLWEWSGILVWANIWGNAFMVMNVIIAQFTNLGLSYLILMCSNIMTDQSSFAVGMLLVTLIIVAVGLVLFLLPPVPGVPIYICAGIILVAAGESELGIPAAVFYTFCVSLVLKLFACTVQQMLIGKNMKDSVAIKSMVGVNSQEIRVMKLILQDEEHCLTPAKVSILVGGPDWPTSVLCGILDLNLFSILTGTLPVAFLIFPTVLAGTYLYLADRLSDAAVYAPIMAAVAASVQTGSMFVAAYYLSEAVKDPKGKERMRKDAKIDQKVKQYDNSIKNMNARYVQVRNWHPIGEEKGLAWHLKIILSLSVVLLTASCYIVQLYASSCFVEDYSVNSDPRDAPLNGDWTKFVTSFGWKVHAMYGASIALWVTFSQSFGCVVGCDVEYNKLKREFDDFYNGKQEQDYFKENCSNTGLSYNAAVEFHDVKVWRGKPKPVTEDQLQESWLVAVAGCPLPEDCQKRESRKKATWEEEGRGDDDSFCQARVQWVERYWAGKRDKMASLQDFKKFLNRVLEVHYKDHEDGLPVVPPQVPEKADRLSGAIENMDEL